MKIDGLFLPDVGEERIDLFVVREDGVTTGTDAQGRIRARFGSFNLDGTRKKYVELWHSTKVAEDNRRNYNYNT